MPALHPYVGANPAAWSRYRYATAAIAAFAAKWARVRVTSPAQPQHRPYRSDLPGFRTRRYTALDSRLAALPRVNFVGRWPTVGEVISRCAEFYGLAVSDLNSHSHKPQFSRARRIAYFLCRVLTPASTCAIGRAIGGRDHSTIIYGVLKTAAHIERDAEFRAEVEAIERAILFGGRG